MRQLGRDEVREMSWGGLDDFELVERVFSRTSRWEIWWWYIFRYDGDLYRVEFNEGATEMQDPDWPEVFEPERVEAVEVPVLQYQPEALAELGGVELWRCWNNAPLGPVADSDWTPFLKRPVWCHAMNGHKECGPVRVFGPLGGDYPRRQT